jgi:hypothetical protein
MSGGFGEELGLPGGAGMSGVGLWGDAGVGGAELVVAVGSGGGQSSARPDVVRTGVRA